MVTILSVCVIVLAVAAVGKLALKARDKLQRGKVIKLTLDGRRQKKVMADAQPCSFCHRKSNRLSFYAAEDGRVVGVCKDCRPQAERRALPRL